VIWNGMRDDFDVKAVVIATKMIENEKEGISSSLTGIPSKIPDKTTHLYSYIAPISSLYLLFRFRVHATLLSGCRGAAS
jgi:hypothetical protein